MLFELSSSTSTGSQFGLSMACNICVPFATRTSCSSPWLADQASTAHTDAYLRNKGIVELGSPVLHVLLCLWSGLCSPFCCYYSNMGDIVAPASTQMHISVRGIVELDLNTDHSSKLLP